MMKVSELIELLEDMPDDAEVRLAQQPNWPFEYAINNVVEVSGHGQSCSECEVDWAVHEKHGCGADSPTEEDPVVYIGEGRQIGYLPGAASYELGWK